MKFTILALTLALFTNEASARVKPGRRYKSRSRAFEDLRESLINAIS